MDELEKNGLEVELRECYATIKKLQEQIEELQDRLEAAYGKELDI